MDNRRPPGTDPEKPDRRENYYKKTGETSDGQKTYLPGDSRFQSGDARKTSGDRYPPRRDNGGYVSRDNRTQSGDGRFQPRDNPRFQPRDNQSRNAPPRDSQPRDVQPRENQPRDNRFQPRDNRFQPTGGRFQARDNNFQPRDNRFSPRDGKFQPRDGGGGRFERRDGQIENRFDNRNDKVQPRKNFEPRAGARPAPAWKTMERPRIYDEMQVTDGKHVGKFLKKTESPKVRPTARRVREAMFKLIFRRVRAGRFLDLCAGGGTVGIEAISRGALVCSFVERSARMCGIIKKNLETLGIKQGHGEVFEIEAVPFLKQMEKRRRFWDAVFFDPPYDTNYDEVLSYLSRGVGIRRRGALVIEHHSEMFFPERLGELQRWRVIAMGETTLSFYERK